MALNSEIEKLAEHSAENPIDAEGTVIFSHVAENGEIFRILLESSGAAQILKIDA